MKERNYGIDLLRLVLMYMITILHILNQGGILCTCTEGTTQFYVFELLNVLAYCAADSFALISGYMAIDKPVKYEKIVNMWFQTFFYSFILTIIFALFGFGDNYSVIDLIKYALPVTFAKFWYFTAFFALFFIAPILNKFIFNINETTAKRSLVIMFILFSILGFVSNAFDSSEGYSFIWLMVLYCIGGLCKKAKLFETKKTGVLILIWAISSLITWLTRCWFGNSKLISYLSPTIVLNGIIMVILFSRIRTSGKLISKITPLAFGIYLFQTSPVCWNHAIGFSFNFLVEKNIFAAVGYILLFAAAIFIAGLVIEFLRSKLSHGLRLEKLSIKIVGTADMVITKLFTLLK